ncbi:MAG TPA: type II secretion system F family protein, partial [Candidatus Paceibacterota bacterium]|nr:type II secretion system F family protein [Candidatus Paceibacterota bacterium]
VLSATIALGIGMAWLVLPKIALVATQLRLELPLITRLLVALGEFLGAYGFIAVPLFILTITAFVYVLFISPRTSYLGQELLFRLPGIRALIQDAELGRFGYLMSAMLKIGISPPAALSAAAEATGFSDYRRLYQHLKKRVEEGNSFAKSFASYPTSTAFIPSPIQQMIVTAERSGALVEVFGRIGRAYEEKTDSMAKNLAAILEPVLLIVVWVGVLIAALSVIMPIYSVIGGLNDEETKATPIVSSVEPSAPLPLVPAPAVSSTVLVLPGEQGTTLNVRALPDPKGEVIMKAPAGAVYPYADEQAEWYGVKLDDGRTGWVSKQNAQVQTSTDQGGE